VTPPEDGGSDEEPDALARWAGDGARPASAAGLDEARMRVWAVIRGAFLGADRNEAEVLRALL
jgi:hypothetical protein